MQRPHTLNDIATHRAPRRITLLAWCASIFLIAALPGCGNAQPEGEASRLTPNPTSGPRYNAHFELSLGPDSNLAQASLEIQQSKAVAKSFDFNLGNGEFRFVAHDGELNVTEQRAIWTPPAKGGRLVWQYQINTALDQRPRELHTDTGVLLRLDHIFPAARVRTLKSARSLSTVSVSDSERWSFESRYGTLSSKAKPLINAGRNFTRPSGWLVGGDLGTRRDKINGHRVVVSAVTDSGLRRIDILAFLHWTLPHLDAALPGLPERVLIAGALAPMWRGGASAPGSLYLHPSRPLISENATSTLLHELIHVAGVHSAAPGADWMVEGLAEYYGLELLRRSGGISANRFSSAIDDLQQWVDKENGQLRDPSSGANTAAAALLFHQLQQELEKENKSLDAIVQTFIKKAEFSPTHLYHQAQKALGQPSQVLRRYGVTP